MHILLLVLAVFLPFVYVFIAKGPSIEFLISLVLILFGYIPSCVYAVYIWHHENEKAS